MSKFEWIKLVGYKEIFWSLYYQLFTGKQRMSKRCFLCQITTKFFKLFSFQLTLCGVTAIHMPVVPMEKIIYSNKHNVIKIIELELLINTFWPFSIENSI